ncbi:hypothetical protein [Tateyamaria pelophila]|nr:hypothetical protein [Tateyamaria pelophila]
MSVTDTCVANGFQSLSRLSKSHLGTVALSPGQEKPGTGALWPG